ncbi:hypothetical protein MKW94_010602 [Papaver nudicaule]|uniref:C2H2-type domain-containing protein n=1 Tax=Papaver nudicaule TaxID=74823 RepID=A0AA41UU27_PAPNU|nr:hypothetical protein [Papaver nudicaule]
MCTAWFEVCLSLYFFLTCCGVQVQFRNSSPRAEIEHVNNFRQGKNEAVEDFHNHGTLVNDAKKQVRCNYCGKEINDYSILKYHLGGIHEHSVPCVKVPEDVKLRMRNKLLPETNKPDEHREVVQESSTSSKRDFSSADSAPHEASIDIRDHGTLLDMKKGRVRCNYCAKEMTAGYSRLMKHLGGIRGDVAPCVEVPEDIKVYMRNSWQRKKEGTVSQLIESCSLWNRNSSYDDLREQNGNHDESSQPTLVQKRKHSAIVENSGSEHDDENLQRSHHPKISNKMKNQEKAGDDSSRQSQRYIGRFFFENGIDFSAANSSTFQKMIISLVGGGSTTYKVPSCDDLKGWILEGDLKAMQERVREVVCSWGSTGCSILLDGWTDGKGLTHVNFVVDSPQGPIFMKSADFSDSTGDVDAMVSLLSGIIEEVGVQNVVQIVTYTTVGSMEAVGKQITEKYKSIFWTVCASHCIGLMLEKIGMLGTGSRVVSKAKAITKFIYSHETVLKLMRKHTGGFDLVSSSRIRSMVPFLILERIESQKKNLSKMFTSPELEDSTLASTAGGRMVADLVTGDSSFWTEVEVLLKASVPLIRALHLVNGEDSRPQLGYIYETMDQMKETIKKKYKGRKTEYQPFWTIIDGIWDNQLHSPIHAAGYYLNPGLFYSDDFCADDEVKKGLWCCIGQIAENERELKLIASQLKQYKKARGAFGDGNAVDQRGRLAPAKWWSLYGGECPELQHHAIKILSQTCTGALRYGLKRSLTEELHMKGRNCVDQRRLNDLTFVYHNLRLQNLPASNSDYIDVFLEPIGPMDEWIGGVGSMEAKAGEQSGIV